MHKHRGNIQVGAFLQVLAGLGMTPMAPAMTPPRPPTYITVMLDGKLVGHVRSLTAPALVSRLRDIKAAKLAEEESLPAGATTIMLDVSHLLHVGCLLLSSSTVTMFSHSVFQQVSFLRIRYVSVVHIGCHIVQALKIATAELMGCANHPFGHRLYS